MTSVSDLPEYLQLKILDYTDVITRTSLRESGRVGRNWANFLVNKVELSDRSPLTNDEFAKICKAFPNLDFLWVPLRPECILNPLMNLPRLQGLQIDWTIADTSPLTILSRLTKLTMLRLRAINEPLVFDINIGAAVAQLSQLQDIMLIETKSSIEGINKLTGLSKLRVLGLSSNQYNTDYMCSLYDTIGRLTGLTRLYINDIYHLCDSVNIIERLSPLKLLYTLSINANVKDISDTFINLHFPVLEELYLNSNNDLISTELYNNNQYPRCLRELSLVGWSHLQKANINTLQQLYSLKIKYTLLHNNDLEILPMLPLRELSLIECNLCDNSMIHICNITTLIRLVIHGICITEGKWTEQLSRLSRLQHLDIRGIDVIYNKSNIIQSISKLSELRSLTLFNIDRDNATLNALCELGNLSKLTQLGMPFSSDEALERIVSAFSHIRNLTLLNKEKNKSKFWRNIVFRIKNYQLDGPLTVNGLNIICKMPRIQCVTAIHGDVKCIAPDYIKLQICNKIMI